MLFLLFTSAFAQVGPKPAGWDLATAPSGGLIREWSWDYATNRAAVCTACLGNIGGDECFPTDPYLADVKETAEVFSIVIDLGIGTEPNFPLPDGYSLPNAADGTEQSTYCVLATLNDLTASGLEFRGMELNGLACDLEKPLMNNNAAITWTMTDNFCANSNLFEFVKQDPTACTVRYSLASSLFTEDGCAALDTSQSFVIREQVPVGMCFDKQAEYDGTSWTYTSKKLDGSTTAMEMMDYNDLMCSSAVTAFANQCTSTDGSCSTLSASGGGLTISSYTSIDDNNSCIASATGLRGEGCSGAAQISLFLAVLFVSMTSL